MTNSSLDRYLSEPIRAQIEQAYYTRVNAQAQFEQLIQDQAFWRDPSKHPALFSDHGVVHVRDVACQVLVVLETINGVLISRREPDRMANFMHGYGVILAYLHDIGMTDFSSLGRAMHPEFAAQAVFGDELTAFINQMWVENSGNVPDHLAGLANQGILQRDPKIIFRELLALSVCHSKSKIPVVVLDNPPALRAQMQLILSHNLDELYRQQQVAQGRSVETGSPGAQPPEYLSRYYVDFEREAYDWLVAESAEVRNLVNDVVDTLRALRCADALRQRGTVQKTSGGYEVFVSQKTGNAVFSLRLGDQKLYLLEIPDDPMSVGEANIASSEFCAEGDLRISFQRGAYANEEALQRSVFSTTFTIKDILVDIVDSFWRSPAARVNGLKTSAEIQIQLESTDDNPRFVELVQERLRQFSPELADRLHIVPSLQSVAELERARYLAAQDLNWGLDQRQAALERISQSGQKVTGMDLVEGFKHVKLAHLHAGETLIQAGAPSAFVYIPLDDGLKIIPLGGYQMFSVTAWMPVGNTGVIRGAIRNADVVAEQDLTLLMIPKEVYLRHWYVPFTVQELGSLLMP